jgi:hypothetical protein
MAEFDDIRSKLIAARAEAHGLSREIFRRRQQLARLKRERRWRERTAGQLPGTAPAQPFAAIDERIAALEADIDRLRGRLGAAEEAERGHFGVFADFTDPREHIAQLSDRTPILLMPLRIETRFKRADEFGGRSDELWVRGFPDDIAVDVFEDTLSEDEVQRARTYWADIWRAGGVESGERGAWRVFLSGQGSGRSHWVIQNYRPLNEPDKPVKADGVPTVVLTVVTQVPLIEPERTIASTFWTALWRAGDLGSAQTAARDALVAAVGQARAEVIRQEYTPRNLADPPPAGVSRDDTTVIVAYLEFPADEAVAVREAGWSQAPHVNTLPDRLVLLGYNGGELTLERLGNPIPSPLFVAPDPSAEEDEQIRPDGTNIKVGPELEWVTDFDRAVHVGMGFRVPLDPTNFRRGFDKLLVLGVRMRSDAQNGKATLEELISHHHQSKAGFAVLPQGRPTNNVEGEASGYSWREDSDVSFDHYFGEPATDPGGWFEKRDGRWLAEMLGLDATALRSIPYYQRTDIRDARAMNIALWPATLGYFMESLLHPVFDQDTADRTRAFFTRHVSARGQIPAIHVGKQPYGILPATPRSRIEWFLRSDIGGTATNIPGDPEMRFLQRLYTILRTVEGDLAPLVEKISFVGKTGTDSHQVLLDVLGLHAASVEHQQRYAESFAQLYNRMAMQGAGGAFIAALIVLGYVRSGLGLLERLGYAAGESAETPDILEKLFLGTPNQLKGPLIDDRPLSETDPIRAYTETGENYLAWLIQAAGTSHDALRLQKGFVEAPPNALLYLMLHHALDLSFVETSIRMFFNVGLLDQTTVSAAKREPKFIQVQQAALADPVTAGGSRWQYLYRKDAVVTGTGNRTVGEFIPTVLTTMTATAYLKRQLDALEHLQDQPTAVLERAFVEHLDLCTYRFDAWYGGLLSRQLETMRYATSANSEAQPVTGIYLGAYGWLENVRPEFKTLTPIELPAKLTEFFDPAGAPIVRDNTNQGYIHAPSLNHAVTAAVLRNGYLSNATPNNPGSLAVDLSSERVRMALGIIEGMKGEQSLGALLGYQFERGLHDRHDVEVDEFIYDLRKAFPLVGDRLAPTRTGDTDELGRRLRINHVEARNVIDGLTLVEHVKTTGSGTYPFGLDTVLPPASPQQAAAISEEADRIANIADAVADLAMAESVHQVVQGNYDRAGAVLDTYSKGKFPAVPEVVRTPRSGVTLTHRTALHLEVGLDPANPALTSPRAKAEPTINAWLADMLPAPNAVACLVTVTDPLDATSVTHSVTQADLGLLPIDLLFVLDTDDERSALALDDLIEAHVIATHAPRPHCDLAIAYRDRLPAIAGHVPFFELTALIEPLRTVLLRSRPLRASDMALSGEAAEDVDVGTALAPDRVTLPRDELAAHLAALTAFHTALQARIDADEQTQIASEIDQTIEDFVTLMIDLGPFAKLETGTAAIFAHRRRIFADLLATLKALIDRWDGRIAEFDENIAAYDADPGATDDHKFLALQVAERLISTVPTEPLPAEPDDFRDDLASTGRAAFVAQRDSLASLHASAATVSGLHDGIEASRPANAAFDPVEVDISEQAKQILVLAEDMANRAAALIDDITARLASVQTRLDAHDAAAEGKKKIEALTAAAKLLFGEDFRIVPDFALTDALADEWGNAWGLGATADRAILDHLETDLGRRFPVDDWFAGVARVRGKMHALETAGHLIRAFSGVEIPLQPLQFPHRPDTPWLGLDFPQTTPSGEPFRIDEDKLLYTAHYADGFDKTRRQAGLLLDEWTEVIPTRTEDTGLAFHYDRPNSEPPQTLLLALPPRFTGGWRWADLVDTVHETMDLARKRAIEPDHIDTTAYARLLPALVSAVTLHPITASLNLAFNNNLPIVMADTEGGGGSE